MASCSLFYFVSWGIVGGLLCIFGFFGNSLSLLAFQRDKRVPATTLLQALATSDFFLLLSVFITDSVPYICDYVKGCVNPWSSWPYIRYIWILTPMAHMCSIWFVVLIALNRYYAVCQAVNMNRIWSNQRTPIYIGVVLIVVIGFNVPRFLEYRIQSETTLTNHSSQISGVYTLPGIAPFENSTSYTVNMATNSSKLQNELTTIYSVAETKLKEYRTQFGEHASYKVVYKVLLVNILLVLVPIILLIAFTIKILVVLRETKKRIKHMKSMRNGTSKSYGSRSTRSRSKASNEITLILILVVVVAITCQAPLCVFHFVRYTVKYKCGHIVFYLDNISKLLVNVNSSANFIIYCLFSPKFRRMLQNMCSCGQAHSMQIEPYASISRREYSLRDVNHKAKHHKATVTRDESFKNTPPLMVKATNMVETELNGDSPQKI